MPLLYGDRFVFTLFTNDPLLASKMDAAGVDRIGIDLETIGKNLRQGHLNSWISGHSLDDLPALRPQLKDAALFARCNPIHAESAREINLLLDLGVTVVMLPYFKTVREAEKFIRLIDGRAHPVLLVETRESAAVISDLCLIDGVAEIHIGLNDMRISLEWPSQFHVLASDFLVRLCEPVLAADLRLGVGGLARAGDRSLPVPSDLVIAQMPRLGATASLISRAFISGEESLDMGHELKALRQRLNQFASHPAGWLDEQRIALTELLAALL